MRILKKHADKPATKKVAPQAETKAATPAAPAAPAPPAQETQDPDVATKPDQDEVKSPVVTEKMRMDTLDPFSAQILALVGDLTTPQAAATELRKVLDSLGTPTSKQRQNALHNMKFEIGKLQSTLKVLYAQLG